MIANINLWGFLVALAGGFIPPLDGLSTFNFFLAGFNLALWFDAQ